MTNEYIATELEVDSYIILTLDRILLALPHCPVHGPRCVEYSLQWIDAMKSACSGEQAGGWWVCQYCGKIHGSADTHCGCEIAYCQTPICPGVSEDD